ncbi:MAG: autoinducer-2 kinase [Candidatus Bathyarchaeia archaeon]
MTEKYLVAIDAGTGSGRCLVFRTSGEEIASATREWTHETISKYPGSQVLDTTGNWKLLCECVQEALKKAKISPRRVAAVSATSMREGMVLYDRDGKEIWACPNADARAADEVTELTRKGLSEKIYFTAGDWPSIIDPPRFLWIKKHQPEIFGKISHMTMLSDWILHKLSGEFATEPSIGSSSGMFDLENRTWSKSIIEWCDLPIGIFPPIFEAGTPIGEVTAKAAAETGLKKGIPVVMGGADTQLGLIGVGAVKPAHVTVIGGTFWQQTITTTTPVIDPQSRVRTLCHAIPDQWMTEGIGFYCGLAMRWFRDAFCEEEKRLAQERNTSAYILLEEAAKNVPPGSNGVIAIFSDVMNVKHWICASPSFMQFDVMSPSTSGKKECFRAIEESAAYVSHGNLNIIKEITSVHPKEIVFCGGASKGFLWSKILADVLGVNVKVPVVKEATALGAAICAGAGAGIYDNIPNAAEHLVKWERIIDYDEDTHKMYMELYGRWKKVYQRCLEMVKDDLLKPMWRAPST